MKNKSAKRLYFLLAYSFFFILFFSFIVTSLSITQIQSVALTNSRGTGGLVFDSTGTKLYAFDNWHGVKPNYITEYYLGQAYNLSTLYYNNELNLSLQLPDLYKNYSISSGYITRNGLHLYIAVANSSSNWDVFAVKSVNYSILHYTMTNSFDITTLNFSDSRTIEGLKGINFVAPSIYGLYVTDDGNYLTYSGRYFSGSSDQPQIANYKLAISYQVNETGTGSGDYFGINQASFDSFTSNSNIWVAPDNSFVFLIERDLHQSLYHIKYAYNGNSTVDLATNPATSREGLTVVSTFGYNYLFSQGSGTLYKYRIDNLTISTTTTTQSQSSQNFLAIFVDPLIDIFPDHETLSLSQKLGIVFIIMLITTLVILFAGSQLSIQGLHSLMIYVVLIVLVVEFLFFISLQYIPIGFIITLLVIALAISYFRLRNGGT